MTRILPTNSDSAVETAVAQAGEHLAAGETVGLPTETVYGLAADALWPEAVVKIFEAKERPRFDPLIVHLPNREWLDRVAHVPAESSSLVALLIANFWPGPLTMILPRRDIVPDLVTAGLKTVAVRISAHPVFRAVIERFGKPLAAPSANRFGRISPTLAEHVHVELSGRIPLIIDGGPTQHGIESTIVAVEGNTLRLLRAGPITGDEIAAIAVQSRIANSEPLGEAEVASIHARLGIDLASALERSGSVAPEAPGRLASHYAPSTPLKLVARGTHWRASPGSAPRLGSLAFAEPATIADFAHEEILSRTGDLREAAATLFAKLRRLDDAGLDLILAEPVPEHGVGIAIMDRLRKAAAAHHV